MARPADPSLRKSVLDAAREVFYEQGYDKARMSDIAARAGVAVGSIYLHFKTKGDLAVALADSLNQRMLEEALPHLEHPNFDVALERAARAALAVCAEERDLIQMLYLNMGLAAFQDLSQSDTEQAVRQGLAQWLKAKMDAGVIRRYDPASLADLIIGMIDWAAQACYVFNMANVKAYEDTLIAFLKNGLIKDPNLKKHARKPPRKTKRKVETSLPDAKRKHANGGR
jgi:AcrR family transcriptional regulator